MNLLQTIYVTLLEAVHREHTLCVNVKVFCIVQGFIKLCAILDRIFSFFAINVSRPTNQRY